MLVRRKALLEKLGFTSHASRSSWSHDLGGTIVFDAWEHHWTRGEEGELEKYPLRTTGKHYNVEDSRQNPRRGHTRWQNHVDLVLSRQRKAQAIVPVAIDPKAQPNRGAKGWLPLIVNGRIEVDDTGQVYFVSERVESFS